MEGFAAAVSQRYGEIGKEQRCTQLCRVREKEKEDKGGMARKTLLGICEKGKRVAGGGINFRTEGQRAAQLSLAK